MLEGAEGVRRAAEYRKPESSAGRCWIQKADLLQDRDHRGRSHRDPDAGRPTCHRRHREPATDATLSCPVFLSSQHEGGDGADRAECEAMQRSHSQLPYFLGRAAQDHTVIKSGYCVKQGAVVSGDPAVASLTHPPPHPLIVLVIILNLLFSDEELEAAILPAGRKRDELLQIGFGNLIRLLISDVIAGLGVRS